MIWITWWLWFLAALWTEHAMHRLWQTRFVPLLPALPEGRGGEAPRVAVIVPARDEAPRIEQTVRRLLAQKHVDLEIVVVDDRSTDGTSAALARLLEEHAADGRLRVVRVDALAPGWLGKCHACHVGARETTAEWALFTDADIWLSEDAIARGVAAAQARGVEHVCLVPGVKHATFAGRGALLGFSLTWLPYAAGVNRDRPRKFVGIGAFNLVRMSAYRAVGGHERLRMEPVDDLKLGLMLRAAGHRTRGFIGGHDADADWGGSAKRLLKDLEKNYFAVIGFRLWVVGLIVLAFASMWLVALLGPVIGLAVGGSARLAGVAAFVGLMMNAIPTALLARRMRWPVSAALLAPILIGILPLALINSTVKTLRQGGIRWRDTFYSIADLKAGLVTWERATAWFSPPPDAPPRIRPGWADSITWTGCNRRRGLARVVRGGRLDAARDARRGVQGRQWMAKVGAREAKPSLMPIGKGEFGEAEARRLLWRAGFGATPEQTRTVASWGAERAVDHLLNVDKIPYEGERDDRFDSSIMQVDDTNREEYRRAQRAGDEETLARLRLRRQEQQRRDREQIQQMQRWWLARMIESPRPLEEKMTLFWHGHFATSYRKIENSAHCFRQNQFFRAHALGGFGDLLLGIIRDPAMLGYLDNDKSRKERPNENLARELMELFSLGVGNYSEQDIKEGARALTGHTFEGNEFVFRDPWHDKGNKTLLGATGPLSGDDFVRAILARPECSRFLAWKLYKFFVRCDIPEEEREQPENARSIIRQLASALVRSKFEVKPALRLLFLSEHFYDEANAGSVIKSPAELVVGAVRTLNAPARDLSILADAMDRMGQELFFPPSVAGWDGGRSWINTSTTYVRQNILVFLLTGRTPGSGRGRFESEGYDPWPLLADLASREPGAEKDARKVAAYLLRVALGKANEERVKALVAFVGGREIDREVVTECLALITATPEIQLT